MIAARPLIEAVTVAALVAVTVTALIVVPGLAAWLGVNVFVPPVAFVGQLVGNVVSAVTS